jgi:hypothetical protein
LLSDDCSFAEEFSMPNLRYIVCAESGSDDTTTGMASFFNVIERIPLVRDAAPQPARLRVTACWELENVDAAEGEFESRFVMILPGSDHELEMAAPMHFALSTEQPIIRINAWFNGIIQADCPGRLRIQNRVRRLGQDGLVVGEFCIDVVAPPERNEPSPS